MRSLSRFVFVVGVATIVMSGEATAQNSPHSNDREAWEGVRTSSDPDELRKFISEFPQSSFTPVARGRVELLQRTRALEEKEQAVNQKLQEEEKKKTPPERAVGGRSDEGRSAARKAEQAREPAELARRTEADQARRKEQDDKRLAAQRAKTEAARIRAEKALRRFEEELAARKEGRSARVRRRRRGARAGRADAGSILTTALPADRNEDHGRSATLA